MSDSFVPILTSGRRVRSLGAALAGGSPLSSPSPSSDGRSPALEHELTVHLPLQDASSQGNTPVTPPTASGSGARSQSLPLGAALDAADQEMGDSSPETTHAQDMDVDMESSTNRELTKALRDIAARLPVPRDSVTRLSTRPR